MAVYAVKKGRNTGKFSTWGECQDQIKGFSGAEYKKFNSEVDADLYLGIEEKVVVKNTEETITKDITSDIVFYVDGSYNVNTQTVGYGLVQVCDNQICFRDFGTSFPGEDVTSRNVLGELKGAMKAAELAIANGCEEITIVYDYVGIEYWANGSWKAKKELTQFYKGVMQRYMKLIKINFVKVLAHSGNAFNDEADRLAKLGSGV